jgi:hypothetical protein
MKKGQIIVPTPINQVFGYWTVIKEVDSEKRIHKHGIRYIRYVICECKCGTKKRISLPSLKRGDNASCGCKRLGKNNHKYKHGKQSHPLFNVYKGMLARCLNKDHIGYKNYGGRGITICERWLNSIENFIEDMFEGYKSGLQLDRKDNDKGYSKENCVWSTIKTQLNNKRNTIYVELNGEKLSLSTCCEKLGVPYYILYQRLSRKNITVINSQTIKLI